MKTIMIWCLVILSPILFFGCANTSTSVFTTDKNSKDVNQAVHRVAAELNLVVMKTESGLDSCVRWNGDVFIYSIKPVIKPQNDSSTQVTLFTTAKSGMITEHIVKTFSAFYQQSLDSNLIHNSPGEFMRLKPKSSIDMVNKNRISPALGIYFIGKDNPFVSRADYNIGVAGMVLIDAFGLFAAVGGPFIGRTPKDKIGISLTGFLSMACWRLLIPILQGTADLEEYNNIVNARYSLPVEIKRE
jgi:hypothetical protein